MYSFDNNIYYNPEEFGYEVVKDIELDDEPWQFHLLVIWRDDNGNLVYGVDMGCSCPSPFEYQGPDDLIPYSYGEVEELIRGLYNYDRRQLTLEEHLDWLRRNLTSA